MNNVLCQFFFLDMNSEIEMSLQKKKVIYYQL